MGWLGELVGELTWLAKSHQQMYDDIHGGLGLNGVQGTFEHYDNADQVLQTIQQRIEKGVKDLSANWSGAAADSATAMTRASAEWAHAAGVATISARAQSMHQATAYVDAKNKMPEPVAIPDIAPGGGFPSAKLIVDAAQAMEHAGAAHQEAARIMKTYESSTTERVGALPQYPSVTATVASGVVTPPVSPPSGGSGDRPRQPGPGDSGGHIPTGPGTPPPGVPGPGVRPPGSGGPAPQPPESLPPDGRPDPLNPGSGQPPRDNTSTNAFPPPVWSPPDGGSSGAGIPRPGSPATGVPVGLDPLGATGGAVPGPGVGRGAPGEAGRGGFGRGPGGMAGPVEPTPGTARAGAAGVRGGAGGASGMGPGAARREEDKEHKRKYVVLDDEHLDDDNPPTAPPVIGEITD